MKKIHDADAARRLFQPSLESLSSSFRRMGESLSTACNELADDMTLMQVDNVLTALSVAKATLKRLKMRLAADVDTSTEQS